MSNSMDFRELLEKSGLAGLLLFASYCVFTAADIAMDWDEASMIHKGVEVAILGLSVVITYLFFKTYLRQTEESKELAQNLELQKKSHEAEKKAWATEIQKWKQGISESIDRQFEKWQLSKAEKEVALLILKGLSIREISEIRKTAEKTARAQTLAIYQKSQLGGRAEFAAFFLEDLLQPLV
jgi:DNA-binding CsgD family transcriptional regulator